MLRYPCSMSDPEYFVIVLVIKGNCAKYLDKQGNGHIRFALVVLH